MDSYVALRRRRLAHGDALGTHIWVTHHGFKRRAKKESMAGPTICWRAAAKSLDALR
jgi:hypothetical protein